MRDTPVVTLDPWERAWAHHVARERNAANNGVADAAHYDVQRMQDNLVASKASCCGEMAVAKFLNRYWSGAYWPRSEHHLHKTEPDIFPDIEVRRVRNPDNPLAIRQRDFDRQRTMVLVYAGGPDFCEVTMLGWCLATEAFEVGEPAPWDASRTTRLVEQMILSDEWQRLRER